MTDFEKNLNNYVETFVGVLFVEFGFSIIPFEKITKDTFSSSMIGASILLVGMFYIFKANKSYKKRKQQGKKDL